VGRLHPLLVHFPIGLILAAAAAELAAIHSRRVDWRAIAVANLRAGAAMAALTAIAGWRLAASSFVEPSAGLAWHRWIGAAAAAGALAAAVLSAAPLTRTRRGALVYRAALFGAAALVAVAGHLGAALVWGADFLRP
jgi:uncharacterized membrane protein